jgi:hypothetical protein
MGSATVASMGLLVNLPGAGARKLADIWWLIPRRGRRPDPLPGGPDSSARGCWERDWHVCHQADPAYRPMDETDPEPFPPGVLKAVIVISWGPFRRQG